MLAVMIWTYFPNKTNPIVVGIMETSVHPTMESLISEKNVKLDFLCYESVSPSSDESSSPIVHQSLTKKQDKEKPRKSKGKNIQL